MNLAHPKIVQEILEKEGKSVTLPDSHLGKIAIIAERAMELTEGLGVQVDLVSDMADQINEGLLLVFSTELQNDETVKVSCNTFDPNE